MPLRLCDLIKLAHVELGHFKIHLATGWPNPPLEAYFEGKFKQWQEYQNRRNFQCDHVVSLIHLRGDKWLFVGVWQVQGVTAKKNPTKSWFEYSTREVPGLEHLSGRVIVEFSRSFRASYLQGSRFADSLLVSQVLEERMSMADFPGYSSVIITFAQLRHIVGRDLAAWHSALRSVAGVYLITDLKHGKHYVGSACGTGGIWDRWSVYASNCHGGNRELRALLAGLGAAHAHNFQFSILEICDPMQTEDQVRSRENHWKTVLRTREFGYNAN